MNKKLIWIVGTFYEPYRISTDDSHGSAENGTNFFGVIKGNESLYFDCQMHDSYGSSILLDIVIGYEKIFFRKKYLNRNTLIDYRFKKKMKYGLVVTQELN